MRNIGDASAVKCGAIGARSAPSSGIHAWQIVNVAASAATGTASWAAAVLTTPTRGIANHVATAAIGSAGSQQRIISRRSRSNRSPRLSRA
jgi:hypothetical protein